MIIRQFFSPDDSPGATDASEFAKDMADLNSAEPGDTGAEEGGEEEAEEPAEGSEDTGEGYEEEDQKEREDAESRPLRSGEAGKPKKDEESEEDEEDEIEGERVGRTSIGDVKKAFPGIFKKFPELKASFFRDGEYSKIYGSPEEAALASQKAENYDLLEGSLVNGSPELLMKELSDNNPRAFQQVVSNWLPQLRAIDNRLYVSATEPVIEEVIYLAFKHAEKVGDKNLAMSARHLANFVFANGGDIPDLSSRDRRAPNPAEEQLNTERRQWAETRFKEADSEIFQHVVRNLDQTIRQGLDPSGTMTSRMKDSIVKDVINEINSMLVKDPVHQKRMSSLWKRAGTDSYSRQSKESIISTYLSGARPLV